MPIGAFKLNSIAKYLASNAILYYDLYAWGLNNERQTGSTSSDFTITAITKIGTPINWTKVSAGKLQSFAINTNGE